MENIIESLNWRYAVKLFDKSKKLDNQIIESLKTIVNLTASSLGLQTYRIAIISTDEVKEKLIGASFNQPQITTASHLFVFCALENVDNDYADDYLNLVAETRNLTRESLKSYESMVKGVTSGTNKEEKINWAARQAYIAMGNLMTAAAISGIDTCPMEGFDANQYAEILGLKEKGLRPFALVALGYRSEDDKYAELKKVRRSNEEMFINF